MLFGCELSWDFFPSLQSWKYLPSKQGPDPPEVGFPLVLLLSKHLQIIIIILHEHWMRQLCVTITLFVPLHLVRSKFHSSQPTIFVYSMSDLQLKTWDAKARESIPKCYHTSNIKRQTKPAYHHTLQYHHQHHPFLLATKPICFQWYPHRRFLWSTWFPLLRVFYKLAEKYDVHSIYFTELSQWNSGSRYV